MTNTKTVSSNDKLMARQISLDWARHFGGDDPDKALVVAEKFYAYLVRQG